MKKSELEKIVLSTITMREIIDCIRRIKYDCGRIKKEIEQNPKKTYTKNQVLDIIYYLRHHGQQFNFYGEVEEDEIQNNQ